MPEPNLHRVELTFDDGVYAKLICPEGGCPAPNTCSECGRSVDDPEDVPRCYACVQDETECWVKSWFDNLSATELLAGTVTVAIETEWEHDSLTARIVPEQTPPTFSASVTIGEHREGCDPTTPDSSGRYCYGCATAPTLSARDDCPHQGDAT